MKRFKLTTSIITRMTLLVITPSLLLTIASCSGKSTKNNDFNIDKTNYEYYDNGNIKVKTEFDLMKQIVTYYNEDGTISIIDYLTGDSGIRDSIVYYYHGVRVYKEYRSSLEQEIENKILDTTIFECWKNNTQFAKNNIAPLFLYNEEENTGSIKLNIDPNPLDSILGEKILSSNPDKKREANFSKLYSISEDNLKQSSKLYDAFQLGAEYYVINQKKMYSEARLFSLLVQVKNNKIINYKAINDFKIVDQINDSNGLTILLDNFENQNNYWKTNNEIQIIQFDKELNQKWSYSPNSNEFPLEALKIKTQANNVELTVNLITGCSICTNIYKLIIDNKGKCLSVKELYKTNSDLTLDSLTLNRIF